MSELNRPEGLEQEPQAVDVEAERARLMEKLKRSHNDEAEIARLRALSEQALEALEPFADIGAWLFARNLPDDTPLVEVRGLNGAATPLTRGHFKAAHAAAWAIRDPEEASQPQLPALRAENERLRAALRGMLALDEENHQRFHGDEDVCAEVRAAREALTPNVEVRRRD